MINASKLLTPTDLARLLGVSDRPLAHGHGARKSPARITVGRKTLYRLKAVLAWLRANGTLPTLTFNNGAMSSLEGTQE